MTEWISAKDRLPNHGEKCLVCGNNNRIFTAQFFQYTDDMKVFIWLGDVDDVYEEEYADCFHRAENIHHWMPLPEPPKIYMNEFYYDDLIKIERDAYKQFKKHSLVTIFIKFNNGEEFKYDVVTLAFELFNDEDNFIHFITNDGHNYTVHMSEVLSFRTNAAGAL